MAGFKCCVPGCFTLGGHPFPNLQSLELRQRWMINIGRVDEQGGVWDPSATSVVCPDHFLPFDYISESETNFGDPVRMRILKETAVPSVFSWNTNKRKNGLKLQRSPICSTRVEFDTDISELAADTLVTNLKTEVEFDKGTGISEFAADTLVSNLKSRQKLECSPTGRSSSSGPGKCDTGTSEAVPVEQVCNMNSRQKPDCSAIDSDTGISEVAPEKLVIKILKTCRQNLECSSPSTRQFACNAWSSEVLPEELVINQHSRQNLPGSAVGTGQVAWDTGVSEVLPVELVINCNSRKTLPCSPTSTSSRAVKRDTTCTQPLSETVDAKIARISRSSTDKKNPQQCQGEDSVIEMDSSSSLISQTQNTTHRDLFNIQVASSSSLISQTADIIHTAPFPTGLFARIDQASLPTVSDQNSKHYQQCSVCGKIFTDTAFLMKHAIRYNHGINYMPRKEGDKLAKGSGNLIKLNFSESPVVVLECTHCKETFNNLELLKKHLKHDHL